PARSSWGPRCSRRTTGQRLPSPEKSTPFASRVPSLDPGRIGSCQCGGRESSERSTRDDLGGLTPSAQKGSSRRSANLGVRRGRPQGGVVSRSDVLRGKSL